MGAFDRYQSPFSWRYGSEPMRQLWGERNKYRTWRLLWVTLADTQMEFGLVTPEQAADLRNHMEEVDIETTLAHEAVLHHDVMAEIHTFQQQAEIGGGIIHLGATSSDIKDNALVLLCQAAFDLLLQRLDVVLAQWVLLIRQWAPKSVMAFTHLQPAEPTTLGYRFALYAQDLLMDREAMRECRSGLRGKGLRGAVGTGASFLEMIGREQADAFDAALSQKLGLAFFTVCSQTYPRKQDLTMLNCLASLGASLHKFAFDLRLMQSPVIGEWSEPFGRQQVGSSAMPFKRNPIQAEKIDSLARLLAQYPGVAWGNTANALLERTLDDSANSRVAIPEAFLIADELLLTIQKVLNGLVVNETAINRNFALYAPFAVIETVLMAVCQRGADRQEMHEHLRQLSMDAWSAVQAGNENPLLAMLQTDPVIAGYLGDGGFEQLPPAAHYTGFAEQKAQQLAEIIEKTIQQK
ncbi:MAG: adenylosuccinate lyase [Anaerolineae bacterium]|nr:adenylosuccinate lyase [Anaerolineae bacterium]